MSSENVGPPPNYYSPGVHKKISPTKRTLSLTGVPTRLPSLAKSTSSPIKSAPLSVPARLDVSGPEKSFIKQELTPTSEQEPTQSGSTRSGGSIGGFSVDSVATKSMSSRDFSVAGISLEGEDDDGDDSNESDVDEKRTSKATPDSKRSSAGSRRTLEESAPETDIETNISPVRRVLNLIGIFETQPSKNARITSSESLPDPSLKDANPPRRSLSVDGQYLSEMSKHLTKSGQSSVSRRPPIHPLPVDSVSPGSSLGGNRLEAFQLDDGTTTPPPAYEGSIASSSSDVRKQSVVVAIDAAPRRESWRRSISLASSGSLFSPKTENISIPGGAKSVKPERRISGRHPRTRGGMSGVSVRSGLSNMSSRTRSPQRALSRRVPEVPAASDGEETEKSSSEVSTPRGSDVGVEGDEEEGGFASVVTVGEGAGVVIAASSAENATGARVAEVALPESGVILPCCPSDDEKDMYVKTGRAFVVTFGIIAFLSLATGMWFYTFSSIYFWWYAAPAAFFTLYLSCQYLGVAVWGKDFQPSEHVKILKDAEDGGYVPTVDVYLPVCNEPVDVLANTWKYVSELDYPYFKVYVLDDGAKDNVRDLAAQFGFEYVRRPNRPELKKAGNLRYAFAHTTGETIVILDADFCPRPDFLRETLPYFLDSTIGIVQTPQFFRYREEQSWVEKGAGVTQEFFYRLVQMNSDKFGAACCCGSCAVYRRAALEPMGGMAAIEHSEDMYTGFKMAELGFRLKFLPLVLAMGTCPDEPRSFFMQQYRWCMGTCSLVFKNEFWNANTSKLHKFCFFNGMLYYTATALLLFMGPLPILLLIWVTPEDVRWHHVGFIVPAITFMAVIVPCWAKQKYDMASHRVRIIQCYAHLFAIKDHVFGTAAAWVPSGGGAKRSSSGAYTTSVRLLIVYNTLLTISIVGGGVWRMLEFDWYNFIPSLLLALISYVLNLSTLWGY